jgi:hypothetical protein
MSAEFNPADGATAIYPFTHPDEPERPGKVGGREDQLSAAFLVGS